MGSKPMIVVQCWDDAVTTDEPLVAILRKHGATGSFNLNAGLHKPERTDSWVYKGTQVARLGWKEMPELYAGFTIANHSLTHPRLEQIEDDAVLRQEIVENRERLQQHFGQEVTGFAYPFGSYSERVMESVRAAGHVYARTTRNVPQPLPPEDAMACHPVCHFLAEDFWARYELAREGGVFYFWGHSYEMITEEMWAEFDRKIARISADPDAVWGDLPELF